MDLWCGIRWRWKLIDRVTTKAPQGGEATGESPVDRRKLGTKGYIVTDGRGAPLGLEVTGADRHDMKAALSTVDAREVRRPRPTSERSQHISADKGYDFPEIGRGPRRRGYTPDIRRRGE